MRPTKPAYDIAQYRIYCDDGFLTAAACASQLAKRKRVAEHGQVMVRGKRYRYELRKAAD